MLMVAERFWRGLSPTVARWAKVVSAMFNARSTQNGAALDSVLNISIIYGSQALASLERQQATGHRRPFLRRNWLS
jgi:hypothetical protein